MRAIDLVEQLDRRDAAVGEVGHQRAGGAIAIPPPPPDQPSYSCARRASGAPSRARLLSSPTRRPTAELQPDAFGRRPTAELQQHQVALRRWTIASVRRSATPSITSNPSSFAGQPTGTIFCVAASGREFGTRSTEFGLVGLVRRIGMRKIRAPQHTVRRRRDQLFARSGSRRRKAACEIRSAPDTLIQQLSSLASSRSAWNAG